LDLTRFLKSRKFKNAEEIHTSVWYDKAKKKPVFNTQKSKRIFMILQKKGGKSEYPIFEKLVDKASLWLQENDPTPLSWIVESSLGVIKMPMNAAKNVFGTKLVDLFVGITHAGIETGVSAGNGLAETVGGPIGLAVVGLFTGAAAAAGSALALSEGDIAHSVIHVLNFIPGIGPAMVQAVNKGEKLGPKLGENLDALKDIPIIGNLVPNIDLLEPEKEPEKEPEQEPEKLKKDGGKRFSSRRHKHSNRWKTQRTQSKIR
jgi:hypothetical protein